MNNFLKDVDDTSYALLIRIIGVAGILSLLFWWLPFIYAVGCLFRQEYNNSIIGLLITLLMIILWRGGGMIYKKLKIEPDDL